MEEGTPQSPEDQPANDTIPQPEHGHVPTSPGADSGVAGGDSTRPLSTVTERQLPSLPPEAAHVHSRSDNLERTPSPRVRSRDPHVRVSSRRQTMASLIGLPTAPPNASASGIDWIVPVNDRTNVRDQALFILWPSPTRYM